MKVRDGLYLISVPVSYVKFRRLGFLFKIIIQIMS